MSLSSFFKNEKLTQGRSPWNPPLKNSQQRPEEHAPWPHGDLLPGAGPPVPVGRTVLLLPGPSVGRGRSGFLRPGALVGGVREVASGLGDRTMPGRGPRLAPRGHQRLQ